jgi:hypothetical protein
MIIVLKPNIPDRTGNKTFSDLTILDPRTITPKIPESRTIKVANNIFLNLFSETNMKITTPIIRY